MHFYPMFLMETSKVFTFVAGLEFVEHDVEGGVVEDEVDVVLVELAHSRERHVVVRVDKHLTLKHLN
jgi:hypothetical protein